MTAAAQASLRTRTNVLHGGSQTAVPGKRGNCVEFPARTRQVGQAEVTQRVGAEACDIGTVADETHHF